MVSLVSLKSWWTVHDNNILYIAYTNTAVGSRKKGGMVIEVRGHKTQGLLVDLVSYHLHWKHIIEINIGETEGAIENGQSRATGNLGYTRLSTKTYKAKNTAQCYFISLLQSCCSPPKKIIRTNSWASKWNLWSDTFKDYVVLLLLFIFSFWYYNIIDRCYLHYKQVLQVKMSANYLPLLLKWFYLALDIK